MTGHVSLAGSEIDAPFVKYRVRVYADAEHTEPAQVIVPAIHIDPADDEGNVDWTLILMGMVLHLQLQTEDLHRRIKALEEEKG